MKPRIRIRLKWLLIHIPTHIRIRIRLEIPSFYSYIIPWICGFKVKELLAPQGWPPAPETFRRVWIGSLFVKNYLWPAAVPSILLRKHCRLLLPKALPKCCYLRIQSKNILGRSGVAAGSWNFQESLGGTPVVHGVRMAGGGPQDPVENSKPPWVLWCENLALFFKLRENYLFRHRTMIWGLSPRIPSSLNRKRTMVSFVFQCTSAALSTVTHLNVSPERS